MVASDTVVGLVGAGILLVALVGVFVYESQQGTAANADLMNMSSDARAKGTATLRDQNPAQGSDMQCQTLPAGCTRGARTVDLTLSGLPDAHGGCYVAFLQSATASEAINAGCMQKTGNDYAAKQTKTGSNGAAFNKITISLEASGAATSPGWVLCSFPVATGSIDAACKVDFLGMTGNHTLSFTPAGANVNVTAKLSKVPQHAGFTYRGWLLTESDAGENWTFVGNWTGPTTGTVDGNISGEVPGAKSDYSMFVVTAEPKSGKVGAMPAGPEVVMAHYNPREVVDASAKP